MSDGIGWIAREEIAWAGYCITLARGLEPGELVTRLARDTAPAPLGECTGYDLNTQLVDHERALHRSDSIAVRYGAVGDLAFAVAVGYCPGELNTGPLLAGLRTVA
ncbi:hypothetical protein [Streptomyces sp. NPDC056938]|uniref:hypothetical protein n=1 Tax=unclassified Streptomyces TaxID=2593676 RepID=UPI003634C16D